MNRLNRRRFLALGAASTASVVLVACGNEAPTDAEMKPTQIPDVAGAPPTLAPLTSTPSAEQGGGDQAAGGQGGGGAAAALTITTLDALKFDPSEADVSPGQTITVKNDGFLQHDLAVDEWGGEMVPLLNNGESQDFTVPEDAEVGSTFTYYCTVPGHREGGMEGTFTIVEAGAASGGGDQAAATQEQPAAGGGGEALTITTLDSLAFDPSEAEVSPGQTVTVKNDGFLQHDLAVDEWGGEMVPLLNNGESQDFTVPDDAEVGATFTYYCTVPGHREGGMEGTFTIVEASAASGGGDQQAAASQEASAPAEAAAAPSGGEALTITTLDSLAFDPSEAEVSPGQTVTVTNDGFLQHDLAVDEWGGEMVPLLNNGESQDFTVPEDAEVGATFTYYCTVPGHREGGMEGTFTIVEGGGAAAGGGDQQAAATQEAGTPAEAAASGGGSAEPITIVTLDSLAFDPNEVEVAPGPADHRSQRWLPPARPRGRCVGRCDG